MSLGRRHGIWIAGLAALLVAAVVGCGSSTEEPATPRATPTTSAAPAATQSPAPTETPSIPDGPRQIGQIEGVDFIVGEGSEATFTVREELVGLPLPNDAVVRTNALSGEVHLDGRPSVVEIDLHRLRSDQNFRDGFIRRRMFPNDPIATFTLAGVGPLPAGFAEGDEVETRVTGVLNIRGSEVPLSFDMEARYDGDVVFVVGRTTFVWSDFGISRPIAGPVVSIEDEVRVEILLALKPSP